MRDPGEKGTTKMVKMIAPALIATASVVADIGAHSLENQQVSLAAVATIAIFTGSSCMWLSRQFARRDQAESERFTAKTLMDAENRRLLEVRLAVIEQKLDDLPCGGRRECADRSNPK